MARTHACIHNGHTVEARSLSPHPPTAHRCRPLAASHALVAGFVDEYIIQPELVDRVPKVTAAAVALCADNASCPLRASDLIVHDYKLDCGKGKEDPVKYVGFYRDATDQEAFRVNKDKV